MTSSHDYLIYVLDLLRETSFVSYKKMMGEYILYKGNVIFGGIYDNRFLVKKVDSLKDRKLQEAIPYPKGKPMYIIDSEDPSEIKEIVDLITKELIKAEQGR